MGAEDDFILNLNTDNCPAFNKAITDNYQTYEGYVQTTFKDFLPKLAGYFGAQTADSKTALSYCSYIKWAYLHNVDLQFAYTNDDITNCDAISTLLV